MDRRITGLLLVASAGCQIAPRPGERATDAGTHAAHDARAASVPENLYGSAADLPAPDSARSPASIQAVIRAHAREARTCFERELLGHPRLQGQATLHLEIAPDGSIANAQIGESTLPADATTGPCIAAAARQWRFAATTAPGVTRVNYPFVFSTDDGTAPPPPRRRHAH